VEGKIVRARRGRKWQHGGPVIPVPGMLEAILLMHLRGGPAHGYDLAARLAESGFSGLNPGLVYRALRGMEDLGWIRSAWDGEASYGPPRRVYSLAPPGEQAMGDLVRGLQEIRRLIDGVIAAYERQI